MKTAGLKRTPIAGKLVTVAVVVVAAVLAFVAASAGRARPASDDASIDADVVHVASAVGGRIIQIGVVENGRVKRGDLLFQIDPVPYQLAVAQAEAELRTAEAQLGTRRRVLSTQRSNTVITQDQAKNAKTNLDLATRTADRLKPLAAQGYVPQQQFDQAQVAARDAEARLNQARVAHAASVTAVDTDEADRAIIAARRAALALARRNLEDTTVRATHDGWVVGLTASTGEMVAPTQSLFTLINTEEWYAVANFRENQLGVIHAGDCATVYSMVDRARPIKGVVQGIGWGVLDQDRINLPRSAPYVERSLDWVRVAQRFPVRIRLERPPSDVARLGASAFVEVKHGSECR